MSTGTEIGITLGVWAIGFLILTLFYKIFTTVRGGLDNATDGSVVYKQ
jgi:hypothetical protein